MYIKLTQLGIWVTQYLTGNLFYNNISKLFLRNSSKKKNIRLLLTLTILERVIHQAARLNFQLLGMVQLQISYYAWDTVNSIHLSNFDLLTIM